VADFSLYMVLNIPSFVMVCLDYRHKTLSDQSLGYLIVMDLLTKISFGLVLLPLIYLIGFLQRDNAENIYKGLSQLLYIIGYFPNMLILSILNFWSKDGVNCNSGDESILLLVGMVNPFTYNFFNPALEYFICPEYKTLMIVSQWAFSIGHIIFGLSMFYLVIRLEERSFRKIFEVDPKTKESEEDEIKVETVDPEKLLTSEPSFSEDAETASKSGDHIGSTQVKVDHLSKTYKTGRKSLGEEKVRNVNFTIGKNEIMGILGPSGAGKSSIFKMLTMAMNRSGGKLELLNQSFEESHSASDYLTRGQIGIVYQDDVMWPDLSVDDNLTYTGLLKGLTIEEVE
jgi:ABC-type multidrug transport system fused ATPase/permease subunit